MDDLVCCDASEQAMRLLRPGFEGQIDMDVNLRSISRWRVGGSARYVVQPSCHADIIRFIETMNRFDLPYLVIGATSNLLFSDDGVAVPVLKIDERYSDIRFSESQVVCQSGAWVPGFARKTASRGLSGLEHIIGIPGTLGGLVCMNGGSQRKGIGSHIVKVKSVSSTGATKIYSHSQCQFAYRHSVFLDNKDVISEVTLELGRAESKAIKNEMLQILRSRSKKFPRKLPNCGSVFVSDPAMYEAYGPPGEVIERCGLKGTVEGDAQISPLHGNFIVNRGNARATDILKLVHLARSRVEAETGYGMRAEALYVEPTGEMLPAHIKAYALFS